MRKIFLPLTVFLMTPLIIFLSIVYLSYFSYKKTGSSFLSSGNQSVAFAALPTTGNLLADQISSKDSRVENLRVFLNRYESPLEPFSGQIVKSSEKYGLDSRLLPAIAMQESNLCKKAPRDSYNCWGFGIYGKKVTSFSGYEEAIETVSKTLAKNYKDIGLITPEQIMTKYTPSNNGDWALSVNYFMNQLQ